MNHSLRSFSRSFFLLAYRFFPAFLVVFLTGCSVQLLNLTPENTPKNPSGIYTFSMQAKGIHSRIPEKKIKPYLVIDGKRHPMKETKTARVYTIDYQIPNNNEKAHYYFALDYGSTQSGRPAERHFKSALETLTLVDKYVSMETSRGPVGSEVALVGRGFTSSDRVRVGGRQAKVHYGSRNAVSFTVPYLEANRRYPVELVSEGESVYVGTLHVDPGTLNVFSDALASDGTLNLVSGEEAVLEFELDAPAPRGGLVLEITTDIPNSIVMPEVIIKEGRKQASVTAQADEAGKGSLYIQALGYGELSVPLNIEGLASEDVQPQESEEAELINNDEEVLTTEASSLEDAASE